MNRRRAFTLLEAALVLFLISTLSITAVAALGGQRVQSNDRMAQSDLDAALDAMFGVVVADGLVSDELARLEAEAPMLEWVSGKVTESGKVSVDAISQQDTAGIAAMSKDGACWYALVRFSAPSQNAPRVFAVTPAGTTRDCSGTEALKLVAYSLTAYEKGAAGSSWQNPVQLATSAGG